MTGLFCVSTMAWRNPMPCSVTATLGFVASLVATTTSPAAQQDTSAGASHAVIELRQYTLHPGTRDVLIDVFERNFVEGQEAHGMRIIGTFRDLDNLDRFVWLREFADMPARAAALNAFYSGPVWKAHNGIANSTMVTSDNVLLLRPAHPETGFPVVSAPLPPRSAQDAGRGLVVVSIVYLRRVTPGEFVDFFDTELKPQWQRAGACVLAELVTDDSPNNFPALPIREGENVFAWLSLFADQAAFDRQRRVLAESADWRVSVGKMSLWTHQPVETVRLQPTARSRLRASGKETHD
jgi:hypothetical protein